MTDPLENILSQTDRKITAFPPTSRYYGIEMEKMTDENGRTIIYIKRRIVPQPEKFSLIHEHIYSKEERLDNITNQYLGDPEQFWRICDANGVIHPDELTETTGRIIKITLPEGIPGSNNA